MENLIYVKNNNQLEEISKKIDISNFKIYEDLNKILNLLEHKKINEILIYDLNLIGNKKEIYKFIELCQNSDCNLFSFNQDWINKDIFPILKSFLGWIIEYELKIKSEKIKNAIIEKEGITFSHNGKRWGRPKIDNAVIEKVKRLSVLGKTYREIAKKVYYINKNNKKKFISPAKISQILNKNERR